MARIRYLQALSKALADEMRADETVFVIGEDVRQALRGVTKGYYSEFGPDRVLDAPISEQAFTGFATGAALSGLRPVVEYQIPALVYVSFEQIVNQAQKFHAMTGGQAHVPVTYLVPGSGARAGLGGQHSDHPYPLFVHQGVKTVLPATAHDAYGLFVSAIRDPDPVIVFAPNVCLGIRDEVPDEPYAIELGCGRIHRAGTDATVVAIGHLVHDALAIAEELSDRCSLEIFDPRTLHPFDWSLLFTSVRKTGRLVVFDDSNRSCGLAAEIVATAAEEMDLRERPRRVTRADVPAVPFSGPIERAALPSKHNLVATICDLLSLEVPA
jgi:acetoin:2,6-dichlorophenolindophenol oxidoreductase subunit beta